MKRVAIALLAAVSVITLGASRLDAVSTPIIQGQVSGLELCPQDWCGAAIFAGIYQGRVGANPNALGLVIVAVKHDPLPTNTGQSTAITGGVWELTVGFKRIRGGAGGFLTYNGDNTYTVNTTLPIASGGAGALAFDGLLDHNVFPPTIQGLLGQ